ncbi:MAG: helix-turn-helix domain-containing protein [Oscillospiraceae bacterium]|nr:helix-turn-helix domain-containing protein [Oscillospiraceae bacterium]
MTTGEKIRARRKELGLSVDELSAKAGKNRATIYRYESDAIEMPASMLQPLADVLSTTPDELMSWELILKDVAEREQKMDEILPLLQDGVASEGSTYRYIVLKTLPTAVSRSTSLKCCLRYCIGSTRRTAARRYTLYGSWQS